ncbi:MAG: hypothetical protein AAFR61_22660 [Bacteroidota bacterium]
MAWLSGGPYYEISLLVPTPRHRLVNAQRWLTLLSQTPWDIRIEESESQLRAALHQYAEGEEDSPEVHTLDIRLSMDISGKRKARLFLAELSPWITKVNFWFFGGKEDFSQMGLKGIQEGDKPHFRRFLADQMMQWEALGGTIGYETDIEDLFEEGPLHASNSFQPNQLSWLQVKQQILHGFGWEYCLIHPQKWPMAGLPEVPPGALVELTR